MDAEGNEKPHRIKNIRFQHWIKDIWIGFADICLAGSFDLVGNSHYPFQGNANYGLASASMAEEKLLTHFDIAQLHGYIGVG